MIEIEGRALERIGEILSDTPDAAKKVLKQAITRGISAGKAAASKYARESYHISAGEFKAQGFLTVNTAKQEGDDIIGSINYAGSAIPLYRFHVTPKEPGTKRMVKAAVLKENSGTILQHAFIAKMPNGHVGVFERREGTGDNRHSDKIEEHYSVSVPQMIGREEVMEKIEERVQEVTGNRIEHELDRILSNGG